MSLPTSSLTASVQTLLTPEQVAEILQLHHLTVLKMISDKSLKSYKLGRMYRVSLNDLNEFLEKNKV